MPVSDIFFLLYFGTGYDPETLGILPEVADIRLILLLFLVVNGALLT
jgi:hypothetical protein